MAKIWDGKHMWIWHLENTLNGDMNAIIAKLKDIGATGVLLKAHDGANIWKQFRNYIQQFKNAGFVVGAWGYVYGTDIQGEANAILDAIKAGADWYVIDAEKEFESLPKGTASQLCELVRQSYPDYPLGYAPFAFADQHPTYPYQEFSNFCNVVLPQVYWGLMKPTVDVCLQRTFQTLSPFALPISPAGQTFVEGNYTPTSADYVKFEQVCKQYGITGVNFWDMQEASEAMFSSVKAMNFPVVNDDQIISDWAKTAVDKAVQSGVMTNYADGFHPKEHVTREQLATILDRCGILDEVLRVKGLK
jgi:hypothetical protein